MQQRRCLRRLHVAVVYKLEYIMGGQMRPEHEKVTRVLCSLLVEPQCSLHNRMSKAKRLQHHEVC